jgi:hypothetical protein
VKDGAKPRARGIAVHDEQLVEVRHLEDWPCRKGLLEGLEYLGRLRVPRESVAAQKACKGRDDEAEFLDEFLVVAGETQETA